MQTSENGHIGGTIVRFLAFLAGLMLIVFVSLHSGWDNLNIAIGFVSLIIMVGTLHGGDEKTPFVRSLFPNERGEKKPRWTAPTQALGVLIGFIILGGMFETTKNPMILWAIIPLNILLLLL